MNNSGEVSAIGGYHKQYTIAAWEIYAAIISDSMEWIELASQEAGNLDDVLVGFTDKILACQIKDRTDVLTYQAFIRLDNGLIGKMFDGWKHLRNKYPEKTIDARLITSQPLSEKDIIKSYTGKTKPNFRQFVTNFWNSIKAGKQPGKNWNGVINELCGALDCSPDLLFQFIRSTHLSFQYALPQEKDFSPLKWARANEDSSKICHFIFDSIGKQKKSIHLAKEDLLEKLGFAKRLQTYFQHDFFVDENHYQPISETIDNLQKLVSKYSNGYVVITGSAGSGKSTLLTKWLQERNDQILKYYSYVNKDMTYDSGYRGESQYFLHDIVTQIRMLDNSIQGVLPSASRLELKVHLQEALQRFSEQYIQDGTKTFIIVDGLDHIEREQKVEYSLLKDLPDPNRIPEGVYFILGSRTIDSLTDLAVNIKLNIKSEYRCLEISALNKLEVSLIAKSHISLKLTDDQIELLFTNTLGHPLFLSYTIEKLHSVKSEKYDAVIYEQTFTGNINDEYEKFWISTQSDDEYRKLLGIICRFRFSFIEISLLELKFDFADSTLNKLLSARYFFNVPEPGKWQYFHNSFKWFLEQATAKNPLSEEISKAKDEKYHEIIAEKILKSESNYRWNIIYHLFKSNQFSRILSIADQAFFRTQWFQFRNTNLIKEDLSISIKSAYYEKNIPGLVRYLVAGSELKQRLSNFNPSSYYEIYLFLGLRDVADSYIYEGKSLLVNKKTALDYVACLIACGEVEVAKRIFHLAEPYYILRHSLDVDANRYSFSTFREVNEVELIEKWASVAINYYSLQTIIGMLEKLQVRDSRDQNPDILTDRQQRSLNLNLIVKSLSAIITRAFVEGSWQTALECVEYIESRIGKHKALLNILFDILFAAEFTYDPLQKYIKNTILDWPLSDEIEINRMLALIHVYYFGDIHQGKGYFEKLPLPKEEEKGQRQERIHFDYLLDYARLYFIIYNKEEYEFLNILPETTDKDEKVLKRYICGIAFHYAKAYHNLKTGISDIGIQLTNILSFFHKGYFDLENSIREFKTELLDLFISLSYRISPEVYTKVINLIAEDWRNCREFWSSDNVRTVIEKVLANKSNIQWCFEQSLFVEETMLTNKGPYERSEQCINQSYLWLKLGNKEKVHKNIDEAYKQTLGIGNEKDDQLEYLIDWLPLINKLEPQEIKNRLHWYLERMPYIKETSSRAHSGPVIKLLQECLKWDPGNGFRLARWLLLNRLINFSQVLEVIIEYSSENDKQNATVYSKIFTRILLFFQDNDNYGHKIVPNLICGFSAEDDIKSLITEVEIFSLQEKRNDVIQKVIRACKEKGISLGIDVNDFPVKDEYGSTKNNIPLELKSGEKFETQEVITLVSSIDQLFDLLSNEASRSNFRWVTVIEALKDHFTETTMRQLTKLKEFDALELVGIGKLALGVGFKVLAKDLAYQALEKSRPSGWIHYYDGGTKINPFRLLKEVEDTEVISDLVFKDIAFSYMELSLKEICDDILSVLELVLPDNSAEYKNVYREIEDYIHQLFVTSESAEVFDFTESSLPHHDLFSGFLLFLIEFPVSLLREHIESLVIDCYNLSPDLINTFLRNLYTSNHHQSYLNIVNGIIRLGRGITIEIIQTLKILESSDQFDVRLGAKNILSLVEPTKDLKASKKELPLTYSIEFKNKPELIIEKSVMLKRIEETGRLRETNDPVEYIGFYEGDAKFLSNKSDIPLINIAYRIMQLAMEEKLPSWYDSFSEPQIVALFKSIELNIPYIRPRMLRLWPALMKVNFELWDSESISRNTAMLISRSNDPAINEILPIVKPQFIKPLLKNDNSGIANHYEFNEKWVTDLDNKCFDPMQGKRDNRCILAEYIKVKSLSDGRATEIRKSFISADNSVNEKEYHFFDSELYNCFLEEYLTSEEAELILHNYANTFDPRRRWLAINPKICFEASWALSEEGIFRWINDKGETMVESLFWMDGNTQNYERLFDTQTGYGWIVVASLEAAQLIHPIVGSPIYFHRKCERSYRFSQKRYNTDIDANKSIIVSALFDPVNNVV